MYYRGVIKVAKEDMMTRMIRIADVQDRVGFRKSKIYQMIKDGDFPAPIKIGKSARWPEQAVEDWIVKQIQQVGG